MELIDETIAGMGKAGQAVAKKGKPEKVAAICEFFSIQKGKPMFSEPAAPAPAPPAPAPDATAPDATAPAPAKPPKPAPAKPPKPEWEKHIDSEGVPFYYNTQTGVSQWSDPSARAKPAKPSEPKPTGGTAIVSAASAASQETPSFLRTAAAAGASVNYFAAGAFAAGSHVYLGELGHGSASIAPAHAPGPMPPGPTPGMTHHHHPRQLEMSREPRSFPYY